MRMLFPQPREPLNGRKAISLACNPSPKCICVSERRPVHEGSSAMLSRLNNHRLNRSPSALYTWVAGLLTCCSALFQLHVFPVGFDVWWQLIHLLQESCQLPKILVFEL